MPAYKHRCVDSLPGWHPPETVIIANRSGTVLGEIAPRLAETGCGAAIPDLGRSIPLARA